MVFFSYPTLSLKVVVLKGAKNFYTRIINGKEFLDMSITEKNEKIAKKVVATHKPLKKQLSVLTKPQKLALSMDSTKFQTNSSKNFSQKMVKVLKRLRNVLQHQLKNQKHVQKLLTKKLNLINIKSFW